MKRIFRLLSLLVPLFAIAHPAGAQECPDCARISELAAEIGADPAPALARLAQTPPVLPRLRAAPCEILDERADTYSVAREIAALEARAFARAESLARARQTCPATAPLPPSRQARNCDALSAAQRTAGGLDAAADALTRAASLFERAEATLRLPEEELAENLRRAGTQALDLLGHAMRQDFGRPGMRSDRTPAEDGRLALAMQDLSDIAELLGVLSDTGLANEDARRLAEVLRFAGPVMKMISDRDAAAPQAALELAADILWAIDSAARGAVRARREHDAAAAPDTRAMAPGASGSAGDTGDSGECLARLALSLSLAAEARRMLLDLSEPRAGPACLVLPTPPRAGVARPLGLSEILDREAEYEKMVADLLRCPVQAPKDGN